MNFGYICNIQLFNITTSQMKKRLSIICIYLFLVIVVLGSEVNKVATPGSNPQRKKVGVVLSGGGAKGFAHVGVLKVLEEIGIPIDYIAGTSMGAVVGGLYAVGYTTDMIDSLIQVQDWNHLMSDGVYRENIPAFRRNNQSRYVVSLPYEFPFGENSRIVSLPAGVYTGQNIYNLFLNSTIGYHHNISFDDLPIPFGCISADVRTGNEIVMREGNLAEAIRASMAIPGVFTPVERDSMLLIDGGVVNNYPVDLVRSMGADIVIGVTFSRDEKELEQSRGTISEITQQIWNFIGQYKLNNNISDTDILITPDVYPFGMMDFHKTAIDTIIQRGFTAAIEHRDELTKLKKSLSIDTNFYNQTKKRNPYLELDTLTINNIYVEGITQRERSYLNRWIDNYNGSITREELDNMISKIYGSGMFDRVYYRFEGEDPFDLIITVDVKEANRLNLGIHFDSNDLAAILANTTIRLNSSLNSMFDITTRLSRDPFLMIDYSINRGIFFKGGINYKIGKNDLSIYDRGKLLYNLGITRNSLNLVFSEFYFGNIMLHLGAQMEHFHFYKAMGSVFESPQSELNDLLYFNYLLNGVYDNLNKDFFPTSGLYFSFQYSLHTDNFVSMENEAPLNVVRMKMLKPFSLSDKVFITPRITARYIMNDSVPRMYRNLVGGRTDGHYMPQQISLQGSTGMEFLENMVFSTDVNIHYNFTTNNYLYTNLNFTIHNNHLHSLLEGDSFLGVNLGYSYLTVAGPLRLELGYSELSRRFHPYVSYGYYF
jgi:NTE family protein